MSDDVMVETSADVEEGAEVGGGTTIWHFAHVRAGAVIGERCMLGQGVHVGPGAKIGDRCRIQNGAQIFEHVTLEDDVFIGPCVVFTNVTAPRAFVKSAASFDATRVKHGASIGANATILPGVTIGEYAMIGAGAVVTKDVQAHAVVVGNPAQLHGWVCRCGGALASITYERGDVSFIDGWCCSRCGMEYVCIVPGSPTEGVTEGAIVRRANHATP